MRRLFLLTALSTAAPAAADPLPDWLTDAVAIRGQATVTLQATPAFRDPYEGENSLKPDQSRETVDVTLYAGVRPWRGGELWANPEIDQGFGLSNTLGVAGFPSAEAYKVGKASPYLRLQRLFFRQTIGLGGGTGRVKGDLNQFAGTRNADRLMITVGKIRRRRRIRYQRLRARSAGRPAQLVARRRGHVRLCGGRVGLLHRGRGRMVRRPVDVPRRAVQPVYRA